jgi:phenylpropionate dioxygenase-like ring-hydroxylating dioxygenase large terminal subunit
MTHMMSTAETPRSVDDLLETGLLDQWYLVCRPDDIGSTPVGLTRLGQDLVLWRDSTGRLQALEDFCPHRGARLSLGHVCGDDVACAYHGVQLNGDGAITATPSTPGSALVGHSYVRAYPVQEAFGAVWMYFSATPLQGPPPPLQFPEEFTTGEWCGFVDMREFDCNWQLVRDNQFDPVHGSFLHAGTHILDAGKKEADLAFQETERGFIVWRTNQQGVNLDKTWLVHLPNSGFWAITDLPWPRREGGGLGRLFRYPTPIDAGRTLVWNYRMQKLQGWQRDVWRFLYRNRTASRGAIVLEQDRVALAGVRPGARRREHLLPIDAGVARIRRLYGAEAERQLLTMQAEGTASNS